jgi:hypothetical protein
LIAEFMKGKYSNEYLSGLKQVKKWVRSLNLL